MAVLLVLLILNSECQHSGLMIHSDYISVAVIDCNSFAVLLTLKY